MVETSHKRNDRSFLLTPLAWAGFNVLVLPPSVHLRATAPQRANLLAVSHSTDSTPLKSAPVSPTPPADGGIGAAGRNAVLIAAFLGWMFDGLEMGIFPLVARPALQQIAAKSAVVNEEFVGHWMGIVTALFLLGAAIGGWVFGWLGDRVGRVRAMSMAVLCYSIFTGVTFFAQTPTQLGGFRFMAALGMGGEWSLGVALVMEVWPEKHRAVLAGLIGAANNVGFALVALLGMSFAVTQASWRWVVLVGASPALLAFAVSFFVPESHRWKAAAAKKRLRPLREIMETRAWKATLWASVLAGVALIGSWGSVQWLPLWADQMAGAAMPKAKAYTQLLTAIGAICGGFLGAWITGGMARRAAYFFISLGSLAACAWLFRGVDNYGTQFLLLTFIVGMLTSAFYGWLPLYLPELFPTRVRATGQGIAFNTGRVLAAVGALQMGALMQRFHGSYARAGAIITLVYIVGMVAIWFVPETKGKPLPE
jgi:SHS family sialic acid transporter-like MFS transporter